MRQAAAQDGTEAELQTVAAGGADAVRVLRHAFPLAVPAPSQGSRWSPWALLRRPSGAKTGCPAVLAPEGRRNKAQGERMRTLGWRREPSSILEEEFGRVQE